MIAFVTFTSGVKYRDVILPMTVIRRLDALLEDSKGAVLEMKNGSTPQRLIISGQPSAMLQDRLSAMPHRTVYGTSRAVQRSRPSRQTSSLIWMASLRMCRSFWISSNFAIRSTRWWMQISSVPSLRSLCPPTLT